MFDIKVRAPHHPIVLSKRRHIAISICCNMSIGPATTNFVADVPDLSANTAVTFAPMATGRLFLQIDAQFLVVVIRRSIVRGAH